MLRTLERAKDLNLNLNLNLAATYQNGRASPSVKFNSGSASCTGADWM